MKKEVLENYAKLLVRAGGNVQPGQLVIVGCDVGVADFGRMIQDAAYDAGASQVIINWTDSLSARTNYLRADDAVFDHFSQWIVDRFAEWDSKGAVYLHVRSEDPDYLNGVDPSRLARASKLGGENLKEHARLTMTHKLRWSLCAMPSASWAKKVFPELSEDEAVEKLGEQILRAARADGEDPIADWEAHRGTFIDKLKYLNEAQFDALRFKNGLGTDITVGMPKNHIFKGGGSTAGDGVVFFPNIPTEEIFSAPDRNRADGRVVASMPLSYMGNLIEGIDITFKDGVVVDFKADTNEDILANLINTDEGSNRLGEVALVQKTSPINQMGTLFYNTLFDENASCHLAIGKAYPHNLQGGTEMSLEELTAHGINHSTVHVDFMFGTDDMSVVGIKADGTEEVIFLNGEYV